METITSFSRDPVFPVIDETEPNFEAIRDSEEFTRLRRRLLRFVFPMSAFFLLWYLTYVLLAAYAHDFMSQRVAGNVTVGLILGLSQFATTVVIMVWYLSFARRRIDPDTARLRAKAGPGRS
jgi:uncharacterized membrane protein (DUF485 family)